MQKACCSWCLAQILVSDKYDRQYMFAYCSSQCMVTDRLFRALFKDPPKEIKTISFKED